MLKDAQGDILFVIANLARFHGVQLEEALRGTNTKFLRRFAHIEQHARNSGRSLTDLTLEEMEQLWQDAKQTEPSTTDVTKDRA